MKNLDMESLYMNVLYRITLDTGRKRTATDAIKMIMPWLLSAENNLIQTLRDGGRSLDFWLLLVHGIVESVANAFFSGCEPKNHHNYPGYLKQKQ